MAVDEEHSASADAEEQENKEASSEEQAGGVPRWPVVTAALILTVIAIVIVYGYLARPKPEWIGVANKNVWDWLDLLVVPAALAIGVYWLNTRQAARQQREEDQRQAREEAAQEAQVQHALEVEDQRAQDAALQAYLDQISHLLTDAERPLRRSEPNDDLSVVARARTLTVLPRLDGDRKGSVVQFLYESGLIWKQRPVLSLAEADLSGADLSWAILSGADLSWAILSDADLSWAGLDGANLSDAILRKADLTYASLSGVDMTRANLLMANLSGANKISYQDKGGACLRQAMLIGANLSGAKLVRADLWSAKLRGANLSGAKLRGADLAAWDEEKIEVLVFRHEPELQQELLREANTRGADLSSANLSTSGA